MKTYNISDSEGCYENLWLVARLCGNENARKYKSHGIYKIITITSAGIGIACDGICAMQISDLPRNIEVGCYKITVHSKDITLTLDADAKYSHTVVSQVTQENYERELPKLDMSVCNRGLSWKNMTICNWLRSHAYSMSVAVLDMLPWVEYEVRKSSGFVRFSSQIHAIDVYTSINI